MREFCNRFHMTAASHRNCFNSSLKKKNLWEHTVPLEEKDVVFLEVSPDEWLIADGNILSTFF